MTLSKQPERRAPLPSVIRVPAHLISSLSYRAQWFVMATAVALVIVVLVVVLTYVPNLRADRDAEQAGAARLAAAEKAKRVAELDRQARPRRGTGPAVASVPASRMVVTRRRVVDRLETAVFKDARRRAARGELRLPVRSAACFEFPKRLDRPPPERQTTNRVMRFECIAVYSRVTPSERSTGSLIGQPFRARVDFTTGRFAWCRIVQRPGELSIQQALVRVPKGCGG